MARATKTNSSVKQFWRRICDRTLTILIFLTVLAIPGLIYLAGAVVDPISKGIEIGSWQMIAYGLGALFFGLSFLAVVLYNTWDL